MSTLLDPSDYFNAWYGKGAPQNYSRWYNKDFQDLVQQIDRELMRQNARRWCGRRRTFWSRIRRCSPTPGKNQRRLVYLREGHNPTNYFGLYDVVRCDTIWLDK